MKITKRLLEKLGCCSEGIYKFTITPELQDININNIKKIIIKNDVPTYVDIVYFLDKIKLHVVDEIELQFNKFWAKYTFDNFGNKIKYENSERDRYTKTFLYDENNNLIQMDTAYGYWIKYEYENNLIKTTDEFGHQTQYNRYPKIKKLTDEYKNKLEKYNFENIKLILK